MKKRRRRLNAEGFTAFILIILFAGFVSVQWFAFVFTPSHAGEAVLNNNLNQKISGGVTCEDQSACKSLSKAVSVETDIIVPVLMYHHIRYAQSGFTAREVAYSVSPPEFERHMKRLHDEGFHPISLKTFWDALRMRPDILPERPVLLTFDDGHKSHLQTAYPVLKKYGFPATFFIYTDGMELNGYMDEDMLKELAEDSNMSIASHTLSHAALTRLGEAGREQELVESKALLEQIIQQPVTAVSYPYGAYNETIAKGTAAAGYDMGFRIGPGTVHAYEDRFRLQRIQVLSWDDPVRLIEKYSGR